MAGKVGKEDELKEVVGDIWDFHTQGNWIVITTNGTVKSDGKGVMGRGVALEAKKRFPDLPQIIGAHLKVNGLHLLFIPTHKIISFPVKNNWWEKASLGLIETSCKSISSLEPSCGLGKEVYMVRPGCGNGGLDWKDVKPILEKYLDDRFIIVERRS